MQVNGKEIKSRELDILTTKEVWNEYQLEDGSVLRLKVILNRVDKADTEKNPNGTPIYGWNFQVVSDLRQSKT